MNNANSFQAWTENLENRPQVFPHQINLIHDNLLLMELSLDEVRAASFLDQRMLSQQSKGSWVPWKLVADIFKNVQATQPAAYIFHVGHCGSTLLSRLLEFADGTRCLREPLALRVLAQDLADAGDGRSFLSREGQQERLQVLAKMWGRGAVHTVIKATSICTDLLELINASVPETRSVFIYNRAETHIATLLAGQNALLDLKGFAQLRLQRLQQKTGLDIHLNQLSPAQLAALSWLSETSSATGSLEKHSRHMMLLEFESLLAEPAITLANVLRHFKISTAQETIENAIKSPVLQTYSKAPEHKYNAQTRAAILKDSRSRFQREISEALGWLEMLADRSELVDRTLQKFA